MLLSGLPCRLPSRGDLQAPGGRHRAASTRSSAGAIASASRRAPTRRPCIGATLGRARSASPAIPGWRVRTPNPRACPWRPVAWRPASVRSGCRAWSSSPRTAAGRRIARIPSIFSFTWRRWRYLSTPSSEPSPTATTFLRAGYRPPISSKCSAPASSGPSSATRTPIASFCACCSSSADPNRIIFRYEIEEGPLVYEGEHRGRSISLYNDTVIAFGKEGQELFRTTIEEPLHVRPAAHANSI